MWAGCLTEYGREIKGELLMIGIIGGSGLYDIQGVGAVRKERVATPYGDPSDEFIIGSISDREVVFLARHSHRHNIPPHRVNYRANVWGMHHLGVRRIVGVNAVGGINEDYRVGEIVLPEQIIDFTHGRVATFYDGDDVVHVDFTNPYCPETRSVFLKAAEAIGEHLHDGGTYLCTGGPRLETAAEIRFFRSIAADLVGMTGMPEAVLARELEVCYVALTVVTNVAAGMSGKKLTTTEVLTTMKRSTERLKKVLSLAMTTMPDKRGCACKDALKDARL